MPESGAASGDEHAARIAVWAEPITGLGVLSQGLHRAGVDQHLSRFAELRIADPQELVSPIKVLAVEAERFPDRYPSAGEQTDQRL